jgi:hypothetical protein
MNKVYLISLPPHYVVIYKARLCTFSHVTHLISYMTCLNNTHGWSSKSPHSRLEEDSFNPVWR